MKHLNIIIIALSLSVLCSCSVSEKIHAKRYEIQSNTTKTEVKTETAEHLALIEVKDEHPSEEVMDDSKVITDTQKETLGEQLRELDAITNTNKFYSHVFESVSKNVALNNILLDSSGEQKNPSQKENIPENHVQPNHIAASYASLGSSVTGVAIAAVTFATIRNAFAYLGLVVAAIFAILGFYLGILALIKMKKKKTGYRALAILGIVFASLITLSIIVFLIYINIHGFEQDKLFD